MAAASTALLPVLGRSLLILTVTATLVYAAAAIGCSLARRASAAFKHAVWGIAALTVLVSPILLPPLQSWLPRGVVSSSALPASLRPRSLSGPPPHLPVLSQWPAPALSLPPVEVSAPPQRESDFAPQASVAPFPRRVDPAGPTWSLPIPWRSLLVGTWLVGLLVHGVLMAATALHLRHFVRRCRPTRHASAVAILHQAEGALGLPRQTTLLDSDTATVPFLAGLFHPTIVLPASASGWPADRLRSVLTHELVHVRRRDIAWQKVARLTAALVWFHPFAWIALRRLRIEAEFATDNAVLAAGHPPVDYAEHLLSILRSAGPTRRLPPTVLSMAGRSPAELRIRAILDTTKNRCPSTRRQLGGLLASGMVAIAAAGFCVPTTGQEAAPSAPGRDVDKQTQTSQTDPSSSDLPTVAAASDRRVQTALQTVDTIDVRADRTLLEAVRQIAWRHDLPIRLDDQSFRRLGVSTYDRPGAMSLADVSLRSSLKRLVEALNDRALAPIVLDPKVKDGAVEIVASDDPYMRSLEGDARQNRLTAIQGTVQTADGRPAPRARIELRNYASSTFVLADAVGRFRVPIRLPHRNGLLVLAENEAQDADAQLLPTLGADQDCPPLVLTLEPRVRLEVLARDAQGAVVPNAQVSVVSANRPAVHGQTGKDGRFLMDLPRRLPVDAVAVWKDGTGFDYRLYREYLENRRTERGVASSLVGELTFALTGAGSVKLAVKDEEGRPVAGLKVYPNAVQRADQIEQLALGLTGDFARTTDAAGEVAFPWIPTWHLSPIWFRHLSPTFASRLISVDPPGTGERKTEVVLSRRVQITGHVRTADGSPVPGARVASITAGWVGSRGGGVVFADHEGGYSIGLDPDCLGMLVAFSSDGRMVSPARDHINTALRIDQQAVDLVVEPARRVHGRIRRPAGLSSSWSVSLRQRGREVHDVPGVLLPNPKGLNSRIQPYLGHQPATLKGDEFEFFVGPGQFSLETWPEAKSPQLDRSRTFLIGDEPEFHFDVEFLEPDSAELKGRVVSENAAASVGDARIFARDLGTKNFHRTATADKGGTFQITRIRQPTMVVAYSADRKFGGMKIVEAEDDSAEVPLMPMATATVRLVDAQGRPVTSKVTLRGDLVPFHNGRQSLWITDNRVVPDADGRVRLTGLILNIPYRLTIADDVNQNNRTLKETSFAEPGEVDLGDLNFEAGR
ncbi:M56 family metallopeptidase [Planctomyces sp. SH-PL14]|uniref:M56 family metallopeptidase n=1 Tax=Planctomyces sp. SH-PL14 TaxID=1632864 RepID=UPI0018D29D86|nr:M56 family metallopeptidase [Planctomyces sp. SH-PL14]